MIVLAIIIGLVAGAAIGYLLLKSSMLKDYLPKSEIDKRYILKELYAESSERLKKKEEELIEANQTIRELDIQLASLKKEEESLNEKIASFKEEMEALHTRSHEQFKNMANEILEEKSKKFTELNKEKMDAILKPLGEKVVEFRQKVEKESEERNTLKGVIQNLMDMSKKMNEDTNNLTKALKGDSKIQGDWGEMILENILERSGLRKNHEYYVQETLSTETGRNIRPDIIISYPDNRKVIIDSKVSLTAYARYITPQSPEDKEVALKEHILSIQKHINELSDQNYQKYIPSLDFVMMFVPIEYALLLALQNNQELWNYAYKKGVLLISPTNLIAALKLIEDLWKKEYQNKNALEIANRGTLLYEKFVGFVTNLMDVGDKIEASRKSYDNAMGQLKTGPGNLINQSQKLKELGIKPKKDMPPDLLSRAQEE